MLLWPSAALAKASQEKSSWEQKILLGQRAPYEGILIPYDSYRYYQQNSVLLPDCKDRLAEIDEIAKAPKPWLTQDNIMIFLGGLLVGSLAVQFSR